MDMDDDVSAAAEELQKTWGETTQEVQKQMRVLASCGTLNGSRDVAVLPRTNALVQDCMGTLASLLLQYELIAQQFPTEEGVEANMKTLQEWKDQFQALRMSLRNANLQAKRNIDQAAKDERDQLLSGGEDATIRRRQLQTQAGMSSAAESITDGLRRTRQMMIQEVERNTATLSTLDQSNATIRMADAEFKGQRGILNTTRFMLTSMQRQDLIDRAIAIFFVFVFLSVCFYIVLKRLPILKLGLGRTASELPVYHPPTKAPPPPLPIQADLQDTLPKGSEHADYQPKLYGSRSVPQFHQHEGANVKLESAQSAPEVVLRQSGRAHDPWYHEEL